MGKHVPHHWQGAHLALMQQRRPRVGDRHHLDKRRDADIHIRSFFCYYCLSIRLPNRFRLIDGDNGTHFDPHERVRIFHCIWYTALGHQRLAWWYPLDSIYSIRVNAV